MIRLPRPRLSLTMLAVGAPVAAGFGSVMVAISAGLAGDWRLAVQASMTAAWTVFAAMWAHRATTHSCPLAPAPLETVDRGAQIVRFRGGPEDGARYTLCRVEDLLDADLHLSGADYKVTAVEQTAFRADFVQLAHRADAGDR